MVRATPTQPIAATLIYSARSTLSRSHTANVCVTPPVSDGMRIWIDNRLRVDMWGDHGVQTVMQNVYMRARESFHEARAPYTCGQVDPLDLALLLVGRGPGDTDRKLEQVRIYRGDPGSAVRREGLCGCPEADRVVGAGPAGARLHAGAARLLQSLGRAGLRRDASREGCGRFSL